VVPTRVEWTVTFLILILYLREQELVASESDMDTVCGEIMMRGVVG
jgi:hypothetical protein